MLELRPNCEWCDRDLPPDSEDARICSYECTYCADCVENVLHNVCATCGGGLVPRPIRPRHAHREAPKHILTGRTKEHGVVVGISNRSVGNAVVEDHD